MIRSNFHPKFVLSLGQFTCREPGRRRLASAQHHSDRERRIFCWARSVLKTPFVLWARGRHPFRLRRAFKEGIWFDTTNRRRHINALIYCEADGVRPAAVDCRDVPFSHLPDDHPPLRIVATDIDKKRITIFSKEATVGHPGTPEVAVADAVAASIAVPLIFSPKVIDGGLVSDLPIWLFDEER